MHNITQHFANKQGFIYLYPDLIMDVAEFEYSVEKKLFVWASQNC